MKIELDGLKVPLKVRRPATRRKRAPEQISEAQRANFFPKGKSGNPGGQPKVPYVKFKDRLAEELAKDAPLALKKQLGIHPNTKVTQYDCLIKAMVNAAAMGDWQCALGIRDVCEGKLTNNNVNLSVAMQDYLQNPEFAEWLDTQHAEYKKLGICLPRGYCMTKI